MIVRPDGDGSLLLVTQPDHAVLSAAIISGCHARALPRDARDTVLLAIAQHDNGWNELDDVPRLNPATHRPYDFLSMTTEAKLGIWPRGVERLATQSPLAAALVAQHGVTVHAGRRTDAAWRGFFAYLDARRDELLGGLAATSGGDVRGAFAQHYALLSLGDLLSLVFCNRWRDPMEEGPYRVALDGDTTLTISPDPFDGASVSFSVPARAIPDREYESDEELRAAWDAGRRVMLEGTARSPRG